MDYQNAQDIRQQSFGDLMSDKLLSGRGIGSSLGATISDKAKAKVTGMKQAIDPLNIAKFMTGGSSLGPALMGKILGRSKEDVKFFAGKGRKKGSADKLAPLGGENGFSGILYSIENLLKRSLDEDKLQREKENNFAEEKESERLRRHKELIEAITGKPYAGKATAIKMEKPEEEGGGIVGDILGAFGGAKSAIQLLTTLGGFVASPLGVLFIGAIVAGTVGAWMVKQIAGDPQAALEGKGGVGMAVAGLGSEGQLPSYDEEQADKKQKQLAEQVDKKGIKSASVEELQAKKDLLVSYGKAKSPEVTELNSEIAARKTQTSPETSVPAQTKSSAEPPPAVESPSAGKALNAVQSQNLDMKISQSDPDPSTVTNNVVQSSAKEGRGRMPIPSVRNTEDTFQRMLLDSTRVV